MLLVVAAIVLVLLFYLKIFPALAVLSHWAYVWFLYRSSFLWLLGSLRWTAICFGWFIGADIWVLVYEALETL